MNDVIAVATNRPATGDIGWMQGAILFTGLTYVGGGVLFATALFRANVLARWASALLALGVGKRGERRRVAAGQPWRSPAAVNVTTTSSPLTRRTTVQATRRATPGEAYRATPRALPAGSGGRGHFRLRYDVTDSKGAITLRRAGRLHRLNLGAAYPPDRA